MNYFIFILINIILPIFIQILLGYIVKKVTNFNNKPLAVIQLYIILPALLFVSMYDTKIDKSIAIKIILHSVIIFVLLYILCVVVCKILKYDKVTASSFNNSITLYNSGNFCLPLVQILYNNPLAVSIQIVIMTVQSIATNTIGIYSVSAGKKNAKQGMLEMFKVPMIYCIVIALALRGLEIKVAMPILNAMNSLGSAMVPVALISLGAQLAETKCSFKMPKVYFSIFIRLIISPILAYVLVLLLGLRGMAAEIAVISSAAPTAVNSVLLAIQYDSDPEFASQAVFFSTIISAITVTLVIFLVFGRL